MFRVASDNAGGTNLTIDNPPVFTSPTDFSIPENQTAVGVVMASDPEHDAISFTLAGGADQGFFTIDANTGALRFATPPDFETPEDANHDNVYEIVLRATDAPGASTTQTVHVAVTDVAEPGKTVVGGNGDDNLPGTTGNDTIDGGNGNDAIDGGDGDDNISGANGNDRLIGGRGNDVIDGGNGDDQLDGGSGNNQLFGGNGNDVLTVGTGNNMLTGGNGDDRFVFGPVFGNDVITDFGHGDKIDFSTIAFPNFAAVQSAMHQVGSDTVISAGAGHAITLQHVAIDSLVPGAFAFH